MEVYFGDECDIDIQISEFLEQPLYNSLMDALNDSGNTLKIYDNYTSLDIDERGLALARLLVYGCYHGYLDNVVDDYVPDKEDEDDLRYYFKLIDKYYEDTWRIGISMARDSGSMSAYDLADEEPDYPLHWLFQR